MLKKVTRANRKKIGKSTNDDLVFLLIREALQIKSNPRTQGHPNSGTSRRCSALLYDNYTTNE